MFTLIPSILALAMTVSAQEPVTDSDLATLSRLRDCGLLVGAPRGGHGGPGNYELAVATHATTKFLNRIVVQVEQLINQTDDSDPKRAEMATAWRTWRYRLSDLHNLTVRRRVELAAMDVDVDAFLAFQNATFRSFLAADCLLNGPFSDVPKNHWASQAVDELRLAGILVGCPDMSFQGRPPR